MLKHVVKAANMITGRIFAAGSKCFYSGPSFESCLACVELAFQYSAKSMNEINSSSRVLCYF